MSILRNLESKIEGLVEGSFSRAFKSKVQPVEIARKLAKEMEEAKTVSVSRVYVPNDYVVFLSSIDRDQFASYETGLQKELSDYLLEHARKEGLAVVTRPGVSFKTDERLSVGEFGIQARLLEVPEEEDDGAPQAGDFGHTMVYSTDREARKLVAPGRVSRSLLVGDGKRTVLSGSRVVLGRSRDCDIVVEDPNVSRQHAELRKVEETWSVHDLGSTNGIKVNGHRVPETSLEHGDEISIGLVRLTFEQE
ncbi:MAG: DUF3662 domain-containing protein [Thermoleophilaceae bacterium]|nr:DUF3662 domain-containing protein [Thermoleophilaceae bacterium]